MREKVRGEGERERVARLLQQEVKQEDFQRRGGGRSGGLWPRNRLVAEEEVLQLHASLWVALWDASCLLGRARRKLKLQPEQTAPCCEEKENASRARGMGALRVWGHSSAS